MAGKSISESSDHSRASARIDRAILFVAAILFLRRALLYCIDAGRDDLFFTLWSGEQVAAGHGLINYNGEPLEISSSLLHVLLVAVLALVAPGHVFALNKLLGLAAGACVLCAIYFFRANFFRGARWRTFAYASTLAALVFNNDFVYWSMGGLETPHAALILTVYAGVVLRYWTSPSTFLATAFGVAQCLYVLVRPEGFIILLFSAIYVAFVLQFQGIRRNLLVGTVAPWLFWIVLMCFRWAMFGMVFPNPVYAKTGNLSEALKTGAAYLLDYLSSSWFALVQVLLVLALCFFYAIVLANILRAPKETANAERLGMMFPLGLCITVLLFVLVSGGDWMGRSRFIVPVMPLLSIVTIRLLVLAAGRAYERLTSPSAKKLVPVLATGLLLILIWTEADEAGADVIGLSGIQRLRQPDLRFTERFAVGTLFSSWNGLDDRFIESCKLFRRESQAVAPILNCIVPTLINARGHLTIISGQMGYFPYMLKKRYPREMIYFIDLHGLATREIAHMGLPRNLGGAHGGNMKDIFGEANTPLAAYVQSHNPDVIYQRNLDMNEVAAVERAGFVVVRPNETIAYRPTGDRRTDNILTRSIRDVIREQKEIP